MNFCALCQLLCAAIASIAASHSALGQCPSDLNADGRTDGTDLSVVLAQWGTCASGSSCSADLNGDGSVNGTDLTSLLAGWGPCPDPSCTGEYAWLPGFGAPGMNNTVAAVTVFDDGSGPALYAGGYFTTAGGVSASRIAKWNGTSWSALGSGMNGGVRALTVFDDGSGPALCAGGDFTTAGGAPANRIARWNGTSWSALGSGWWQGGGMNSWVEALTVFDDGSGPALYAGGDFTMAGDVAANRIARWNGTSWSSLGASLFAPSGAVRALAVFNGPFVGLGSALYVGGSFDGGIRLWARGPGGFDWLGLPISLNGTVNSLMVFDDGVGDGPALYAGGGFTLAVNPIQSNVQANRIVRLRWSGSNPMWSSLGSPSANGVGGEVFALADFDDRTGTGPALYAGGSFSTASGVSSSNIAKWGCTDP